MKAAKRLSDSYRVARAEQFWSKRLASTDPLAAVLTYNARPELNQAYDVWEKACLQEHLGSNLAGRRVLDLGAGVGRLSLFLAKQGAEVIALDNSRAMLEKIGAGAGKGKLGSRITTVHAPSHQIPLDDRSVDLVVCFGLLEHLPEKVRKETVREAVRVLKRNGQLLVVVNNTANPLLKARYPLKKQKTNGYFAALVGLPWIERVAKSLKMRCSVLSANPGYAMVHYLVDPLAKKAGMTPRDFDAICRMALKADLAEEFPKELRMRFASHFMVALRRR
jgi:ubiquinone/menaquinone biosynthesis C-methylase UbiE